MPLNADYLRDLEFPPLETEIGDCDAMLYALSIGLGRDPLDAEELPYVYEAGLRIFPTMPLVVGHPGNWMIDPRTGITRSMVVHGAQRLWTHGPLSVGSPIVIRNRITDLFDKGEKGAIILIEREIRDRSSNSLLSRGESWTFCRADGDFGGASSPTYDFAATPARPADASVDITTRADAALLYRLNHDRNPIHADPAAAGKAGFDRPILHGLCTFGVAAVALSRTMKDGTLASIEARFSRPVFPGETISVDIWREGGEARFRARIAERNIVVLDGGSATFV